MRRHQSGHTVLVAAVLLVCLSCSLFVPSVSTRRVNMLHITDLHGWVFGHPHVPELNADFGDFASLVEHMQANAAAAGEEFMLFDSGDIVEGTGLSDATDIHGQYIFPAVQMVSDYSGLCIGNHDIGHDNVVQFMLDNFIPYFKNSYLTDNSLIKKTGHMIGEAPYRHYQTALGTNVLVLGYLFNFTQPTPMTTVVPVSQSLMEAYFQEAMAIKDVDLVVVTAHIDPTSTPELSQIYTAIRKARPGVPIAIMSGHRHITYFSWLDANAFTIESGKYFEVLGHVIFDLADDHIIQDFAYEWVPTSRSNFYKLANKTESEFLTTRGKATKDYIHTAFEKLQLNTSIGCAPATYTPSGNLTNPLSLYNLYINTIAPVMLFNASLGVQTIFMTNTGNLRYSLYAGRVVMNDIYTVIPFKDVYYYFTMSGDQLTQAINYLNGAQRPHNVPAPEPVGRTPYVELQLNNHHSHGPQPFQYYRTTALPPSDSYLYSNVNIETGQKYALMVAAYDAIALGKALQALFPNQSWNQTIYPTSLSATAALQGYVQKTWPCRSSCPCE